MTLMTLVQFDKFIIPSLSFYFLLPPLSPALAFCFFLPPISFSLLFILPISQSMCILLSLSLPSHTLYVFLFVFGVVTLSLSVCSLSLSLSVCSLSLSFCLFSISLYLSFCLFSISLSFCLFSLSPSLSVTVLPLSHLVSPCVILTLDLRFSILRLSVASLSLYLSLY